MELRRYWQIVRRYWLIIAVLTLVGLLAAYQYYTSNRPTYQAVTEISIFQQPSPDDNYSGIYANQSSEFAADDFTRIIAGNRFMMAVSSQLKEGDINLTPEDLKGMVTTERKHREVTVTTNHSNPNTALQVSRAIAGTMENNAAEFVKPRPVTATIINAPGQANLTGGRTVLLAVIRVLAGLLAGVGLALLLAYLDNTLHTKADTQETLNLPVLGQIPPATGQPASRTSQTVALESGSQAITARMNTVSSEQDPANELIITRQAQKD